MQEKPRTPFNVSCKAVLLSEDRSQILLAQYRKDNDQNYSLPGGHMEADETPEQAIRRELNEELGIEEIQNLTPKDFFMHRSGKIILGYLGTLERSQRVVADGKELSGADWVDIDEVERINIPELAYVKFIAKCLESR